MSTVVLGKGAYGEVVKDTANHVAVKTFHKLPHIIQEFAALHYLQDCKYVVHAKSVNLTSSQLTMELYDLSFRKYMVEGHCCCEECLNLIFRDVLLGLIELNDRKLSHSDIKPGNILINLKPLKAVLGDCGFVSIGTYSKQQRTAQSYRDIDVVNDLKHDIFSLGVMMLELYYFVKPVVHDHYNEYQKIISKKVTNVKHKALLKKMMSENREERPSARDILKTLYDISPAVYVHAPIFKYDFVSVQKEVYQKYDAAKIKELEEVVKLNYKQLGIKRAKTGVKALIVYMNKVKIDIRYLNFYFAAMMIVLASLFGNRSPVITDILMVCDMPEHNKKRLIYIIDKMIHDRLFLHILFN